MRGRFIHQPTKIRIWDNYDDHRLHWIWFENSAKTPRNHVPHALGAHGECGAHRPAREQGRDLSQELVQHEIPQAHPFPGSKGSSDTIHRSHRSHRSSHVGTQRDLVLACPAGIDTAPLLFFQRPLRMPLVKTLDSAENCGKPVDSSGSVLS